MKHCLAEEGAGFDPAHDVQLSQKCSVYRACWDTYSDLVRREAGTVQSAGTRLASSASESTTLTRSAGSVSCRYVPAFAAACSAIASSSSFLLSSSRWSASACSPASRSAPTHPDQTGWSTGKLKDENYTPGCGGPGVFEHWHVSHPTWRLGAEAFLSSHSCRHVCEHMKRSTAMLSLEWSSAVVRNLAAQACSKGEGRITLSCMR